MKLLVIAGSLLLTGCAQVNFGSSVINVTVTKTQAGEKLEMSGSDIKDLVEKLNLKSEADGSLK